MSKPMLPFGSERMLERVVRRLGQAVEAVLVVASPGQELPALPAEVRVVHDRAQGRGPMEGLYVGLSALEPESEAAFVVGCDVPRLVPAFVTRMTQLLGNHAMAVPVSEGFLQPLAAVYRREVAEAAARLLAAGELCPRALFETLPTRRVSAAELLDADPEMASLDNINQPADYLAALAREKLTVTAEILRQFSPPPAEGH